MKKSPWVSISFLLFFFLSFFLFYNSVTAYQPFPDTGQTKCYNDEQEIDCPEPGEPFYGQDAQYQPRLPRSYTKLGHGGVELPAHAAHVDDGGDWIMTRDNVTGLIWEIKTDANKDDQYDWYDAQDVFIAQLNSQQFGGFSDWRLPDIKELSSLVNSGNSQPSIDEEWFPRTRSPSNYWSSTTTAYGEGEGQWSLTFQYGNVYGLLVSYSLSVRAVRSESSITPTLVNNGDGTVTDTSTGLIWQKATAPGTYNWQAALDYCENLTLAGHSDWRLPNRNELQTLVDYSRFNPTIDPLLTEETNSYSYWASTTLAEFAHNAWHVAFNTGHVYLGDKSYNSYYVRAVRSGQSGPDGPLAIISPKDETITASTITFNWSDVEGAVSYEIIVDNNEGMGSPEIHEPGNQQAQLTESQYEVTNWLDDNVYYWKVIAHLSDGTTLESDVATFTYQMAEAATPVWVPLFRLYKGGDAKDHFYTTLETQAQAAMDDGYAYERRECYVSDRKFFGGTPLFRLFNPDITTHYYTTDGAAKDDQVTNNGYQYEGIQGWVYSSESTGAEPLYRLKRQKTGGYHYFMSMRESERQHALDHPAWGFEDDGIAGYAYPAGLRTPLAHSRPQGSYGGVDMATRAFRQTHSSPGLKLSGYGPSMQFRHTYNAFDYFQAPMGQGWTHSYYIYLMENENQEYVVIKWGDGTESHFERDGNTDNYIPQNGEYSALIRVDDGVNTGYDLTTKDQTEYQFRQFETNATSPIPGIYLIKITDRNNNSISLNWSQGILTRVTADNGHEFTFDYGNSEFPSLLTRVTENALGRHVAFEYDPHGRMTTYTDARGNITEYAYTENGLLSEIIRPEQNTYTISYDNDGTVVSLRKGNDQASLITPGPESTQVTTPQGNTIDFKTTDFRLTQLTDGRAQPVDFEYGNVNNPNLPTMITDRKGSDGIRKETHYEYDQNGNVTKIINHLRGEADFAYDADNNLILRSDFHPTGNTGNITEYEYDANGNLTDIIFPDNTSITFSHNSYGLVASTTDGRGFTTQYAYDTRGNLSSITDPEGNITQFSHDNAGRLQWQMDAEGKYTYFDHDSNNNMIRTEDHTLFAVNALWNGNNNLDNINWSQNAATITTSYGYDDKDRLVSVTDPLGHVTQYSYNPDGAIADKTDRNNVAVNYAYDENGLLTQMTYPNHTRNIGRFDNGLIQSITGPAGTTQFQYTVLDQIEAVTGPYNQTVQYEYYERDNLTKITYPGEVSVVYDYDALNRLKTVEALFNGAKQGITQYVYDNAGNLLQINRANGTSATFTYDNASRLIGLTERDSNNDVICSYAYTLDGVGNHVSVAEEKPLAALPPGGSTNYEYNKANQLISAGDASFSYDNKGSRITRTEDAHTISYDWDAENMLTGIFGPDRNIQYAYDGLNNRVAKTVDGVTIRYVLDHAASMIRVLAETDDMGNVDAYYIYGLGLDSRIDSDGNQHFYHFNNRGDTTALSNENGIVTDKYAYDEYGLLLETTGSTPNPFTFVGRHGVMDEDVDLYFMRARYYDAEVGRFLSEDPLGFGGGDWNLYAYVGGDPLVKIDPEGELPVSTTIAICAGVAIYSAGKYLYLTIKANDVFEEQSDKDWRIEEVDKVYAKTEDAVILQKLNSLGWGSFNDEQKRSYVDEAEMIIRNSSGSSGALFPRFGGALFGR